MEDFNSDIKFKITLSECHEILKKCLNRSDFQIINVNTKSLRDKVYGCMGGYYQIQIKLKIDGEIIHKIFFEKRMKTYFKIQDEMIKQQKAYEKEVFIYNVFIKDLENESTYSTNYLPKCYFTKPNLSMILEDLSELGFKSRTQEEFLLDVEHFKVALSAVAKFHAGSIIYEHRKSNNSQYSLLKEYSEVIQEPLYIKNDNYLGNKLYVSSYKTILKIIDICPLFDKNKENIKNIFLQNVDKVYDLVKPSSKYYNVICHGDLWASNLLFRYKNDIPVDCKIIDFQSLRYTIPAHDVMNLIYCASDTTICNKYINTLLLHYHMCLSESLNENGLNVNNYVTFNDFKESCDYILPFVLIQKTVFFLFNVFQYRPELYSDENLFEKFIYEENFKTEVCLNEYKIDGYFRHFINDTFSEYYKFKKVLH